MKYFLYILFLIQIQNCKSDTVSAISSNKEIKLEDTIQDNYLINSIDKIAIGNKIEDEDGEEIKKIKINLLNKETNKIQEIDFTTLIIQFDVSPSNTSLIF